MSFDHSLHMFRSPKLQSVVEDAIQFFMATPVHSLPPPSRFIGSGVVDGFGNHDPGAGRYNQARSEWDILHPGRFWAQRLTGESPRLEDVIAKLQRLLA